MKKLIAAEINQRVQIARKFNEPYILPTATIGIDIKRTFEYVDN